MIVRYLTTESSANVKSILRMTHLASSFATYMTEAAGSSASLLVVPALSGGVRLRRAGKRALYVMTKHPQVLGRLLGARKTEIKRKSLAKNPRSPPVMPNQLQQEAAEPNPVC